MTETYKKKRYTLRNIEKYIFVILNSMVFSIPILLGFITDFKPGKGNWNSVEIWIYASAYILILVEIIYLIKNALTVTAKHVMFITCLNKAMDFYIT